MRPPIDRCQARTVCGCQFGRFAVERRAHRRLGKPETFRWKAPTPAVTRHGDTIYVSGFPPFDPATGEVVDAPVERQTELVLEQMKLCLETAGSSLEDVLKCNVYCTSVEKFAAVNAVYSRRKMQPQRAALRANYYDRYITVGEHLDCFATEHNR
jgi:enamine deaminase RidA (YjgF/YER057c/UK114 family)